jgi:hypothetical protein
MSGSRSRKMVTMDQHGLSIHSMLTEANGPSLYLPLSPMATTSSAERLLLSMRQMLHTMQIRHVALNSTWNVCKSL